MGSTGGSQSGGSDFVTLTIPKKQAQDLLQALNNALGGGGYKNPKSGKTAPAPK